MNENNLFEKCQSAYTDGRGTELTLTKVQNDILKAIDHQEGTCRIMLDISTKFDSLNHTIILVWLEKKVQVTGNVLILC